MIGEMQITPAGEIEMPVMMPFFGMPLIFIAGAVLFCILMMIGMMILMHRMMPACCSGYGCRHSTDDPALMRESEGR
ncbi:MAG: hypothetical protein BWY45_02130 [Euryarchaeota archaeon ADurb.Bin294]|jgi:hypothetical protein|nr:MAG: hypothetical protein BWY45_02130 [Euryarchaeota archaeon ADurb.Bin294]